MDAAYAVERRFVDTFIEILTKWQPLTCCASHQELVIGW